MCSGSGVAPSGSGFSTTCLVGVTGAGFLSIPGFRRLARRRSRHSRTHLLHQIVHVTKLSTDVIASSTSNSSIMLIVPCCCFFFFRCLRSDRAETTVPFLGSQTQRCFFLCHLWLTREKDRSVFLSPSPPLFVAQRVDLWGRLLKDGAGENRFFFDWAHL